MHNKFIYIFWSNYFIFRSSRGTIHDSLISLLSIVIVKYQKGPIGVNTNSLLKGFNIENDKLFSPTVLPFILANPVTMFFA